MLLLKTIKKNLINGNSYLSLKTTDNWEMKTDTNNIHNHGERRPKLN